MYTFETEKYSYKISKNQIFIFGKDEILIKRIQLPKKDRVTNFDYMYYEDEKLKVFFEANDNYQYKATFNEDTFEFSDWGLTK